MKSGWFYRAFDVGMDVLVCVGFVLAVLFAGACILKVAFNLPTTP